MTMHFVVWLFVLSMFIAPDIHATGSLVVDFAGLLDPSGIPQPWRLKVNAGAANIALFHYGEVAVVRMRSEEASFSLERDFMLQASQIGAVRWNWKADVLPPQGDVRYAGRNDQALQVMFAFEGRRIISYVWDSNAPVGTVRDESLPWPISLCVKVLVIASGEGERGTWVSVQRNLATDYQKLFGTTPSALRGIRIQTNSQHTASLGIGTFGPISFLGPRPIVGKAAP